MVRYVSTPGPAGCRRFRRSVFISTAFALAVVALWTAPVGAQDRSVPSLTYHAIFPTFYDGEFKDALDEFRAEGRSAIKTPQSRWIDSICYETMVGECYYHMGHNAQALEHYTAALNLFVAFPDYMLRVQFPPAIQPSAKRVAIPWGASTRRSVAGQFPRTMLISQGRINNNDIIKRGGVVQQAILYPLEVQEIVRCTTLAIRRRTRLMGPACQLDPLTASLKAVLSRPVGPPNHWSEAWVYLQRGLAMVAAGEENQAVPYLERSVLAAGEFDHPLTSTALYELGRLAMIRGDYDRASRYFEEATYAAVVFPDWGILEEAFEGGALAHIMANREGMFPPLAAAIKWARERRLKTSLLLCAAENAAILNQPRQAGALLDEARQVMANRELAAGRPGSRLNYLNALVLFQQMKVPEGNAALASAMAFMQQSSLWLFHISLIDNLYTSGKMTPRKAMDLYDLVLRDPQPSDWSSNPMEAMAVLLAPHPLAIEHWFEVALNRRDAERILEIADRARRHRFFNSLAFGGRLQSLRWILEGPTDMLDQQSQLHRRDLLAKYPAYDRLAQQARSIRDQLKQMPLVAADQAAFREQGRLMQQLEAISLQQEAVLREIALRREPAGLVFPPLRTTQDIQQSLPEGTALLAFYATSRNLYGFLLNNQNYDYWQIGSPETISRQAVALLRSVGNYQQNHELALKDLADNGWKKPAQELLDAIVKGSQADFAQRFDELVVVPDGLLWYVPFEALQVSIDGKLRPLISRFRVRYAPTASLATPIVARGRKPTGNTAVVLGRLYPRDGQEVAQAAFDQLAGVLPGSVALNTPAPAASYVYGSLFDRLIVYDDLDLSGQNAYSWMPVPLDRKKPGNTLGDWLWLPWGGPEEIILPGFHTAAEDSLKTMNRTAPGDEIFLSVCGMMSSGARTLLLSRWRTGGQTSYDLVREFAQELPHTSPSDAWQRSVFLAAGSPLNLEAEPRLQRAVVEDVPKASHPFFWGGYMLVDSGNVAQLPDTEPEEPVLRFKQPGQPAERTLKPGVPAAGAGN